MWLAARDVALAVEHGEEVAGVVEEVAEVGLAAGDGGFGGDAVGDVVDDGAEQGLAAQGDGGAVDLDIAHGAIGTAVAEVEVLAFAAEDGGDVFLADELGRKGVDLGEALAGELALGPAVEGDGGGVGLDDGAVAGVDEEHEHAVVGEGRGSGVRSSCGFVGAGADLRTRGVRADAGDGGGEAGERAR